MSFESLELDPVLLQAVEELGFTRPTTIQTQVIPVAMEGRDIMASAPTGTGKTAAFLLPMMQHMIDFPRRKPGPARALILTPTRELALQITEQAEALAAHTFLKVASIIGGVAEETQLPALEKTVDIVIATPGRLMQYIEDERFDSRDIEVLVLDEADRMLDMGFIGDVDRIAAEARWRKQTMLFSATLEGAGLKSFSEDLLKDPAEFYAEPPRSERKKIQQLVYFADTAEHKFKILKHLLQQEEVQRSIIFVKTRERLAELVSQLQGSGIDCAWLRGEMEQEKRVEALQRFRSGKVTILVATDVAARGIDLPDVSHVFNYDMPRSADTYVHRIGRTGRAGKKGCAINLVEAHDVGMMERVERYTEEKMMRRVVDSMRPQHKISKVATKKKEKKDEEKKTDKKPKEKIRHRVTKNKGKPDWAKKHAEKAAKVAAKDEAK
ncbi:ATP-dependent RNA helicase SrmB [Tolumonas osonensis]|uniref:ATP-dependent RNA helicase SrmB n=1 Tax=Tolumonas osonensis TaxID=675874 RepID=A0A841GAW4_9GAMM|nr:ATP-dependent RNA helicase SrmB [Tolumonas osonensis]MBB6056274.1 ATP-dependent RNA helicase SrmB [Tolumonas osonensis]